MKLDRHTRRKQQRGVAMVMALLTLLVLAIIGIAFMSMTTTESSANKNYKDSQRAYFASRAGLENVRAMLWNDANFQAQVEGLAMPSTANTGIIYALNPAGAQVIDPRANPTLDDELCNERFTGLVLGNLTPGATPGAPCGTGASTELMPTASKPYYRTAAVVPIPAPITLPDIALAPGDIPGTNTASALPFQWVRITNKQNLMGLMNATVNGKAVGDPTAGNQVCWDVFGHEVVGTPTCAAWNADPNNSFDQANPVWLLTSLAIAPGGSRRMTQMEVAFTPPIYPPAPITALAPITTVGSSLTVDGYDNCTCTPTGAPKVPGVPCKDAYAIASGGTVSSNGNPTLISGETSPTGVSTPTEHLDPWPYDVPKIIDGFISNGPVNVAQGPNAVTSCSGTPDFTSTPAVYASCSNITGHSGVQAFGTYPTGLPNSPTGSVPQATYVPGSVSLHADVTGSGILIIDGDLNVNGSLSWYGLILVRGQINFTGGGSQVVNMYGGILAGEDVNAQDIPIGDKVGGSFSFVYDTCALKQSGPPGPPRLLATHEVMY
jgi:hypothetical protein